MQLKSANSGAVNLTSLKLAGVGCFCYRSRNQLSAKLQYLVSCYNAPPVQSVMRLLNPCLAPYIFIAAKQKYGSTNLPLTPEKKTGDWQEGTGERFLTRPNALTLSASPPPAASPCIYRAAGLPGAICPLAASWGGFF
ncbi:MAG: hypothetical protein KME26_20720 [Oscillatoria princeps RMCB-10]|jgi:hypothetical protein|nr:hypothetical protein [Oscillatoria princeps RMCB-10]